jgi:type 1 glutamine amidotransferase
MASGNEIRKKRALLLFGGWAGHDPKRVADFARSSLLAEFEVVDSQDLSCLRDEVLSSFDLLLPIWTFGELSESQESALLNSVASGLGLVAWHGFASAFLASRPHKHLIGGQFVAHPGGNSARYQVRFKKSDDLVNGLDDFTLTSEQYYVLVDPAVKVLATSTIIGEGMPWLAGVEMPVAWTRAWNRGRVFYCSLGHTVDVLEQPSVRTLLKRAVHWASRDVSAATPR